MSIGLGEDHSRYRRSFEVSEGQSRFVNATLVSVGHSV